MRVVLGNTFVTFQVMNSAVIKKIIVAMVTDDAEVDDKDNCGQIKLVDCRYGQK